MTTFRELIKESPVGKVGRTKEVEALLHIENSNLEKEFKKIVKKLGGKQVARALLASMNPVKKELVEGREETPETFLRDVGYKIKSATPTKDGKELELFKTKDAKNAFEELKDSGFMNKYDIDLAHNIITYKEIK